VCVFHVCCWLKNYLKTLNFSSWKCFDNSKSNCFSPLIKSLQLKEASHAPSARCDVQLAYIFTIKWEPLKATFFCTTNKNFLWFKKGERRKRKFNNKKLLIFTVIIRSQGESSTFFFSPIMTSNNRKSVEKAIKSSLMFAQLSNTKKRTARDTERGKDDEAEKSIVLLALLISVQRWWIEEESS
jgi:hypothetical protein